MDSPQPCCSEGARAFLQVNLTLPEDVAKRFLAMLEKIAEIKKLPPIGKVNKRWQFVADPMEMLLRLTDEVPDSLWEKL
jgi:hypothetical protein